MLKEIIATGKDINIAKENARAALGAGPLDDVNFEIIDLGSRGFLGFMAKPAKVKATIEIPDAHEPRQRKERPRREKENAENGANSSEVKENRKPSNHKKNNHKKNDNKKAKEAKNDAPKSVVVPEESLKMERREVGDGEDMSYDFVKTVLSDIGLNATAELYACEDGTRRITIVGDDAATLIGHHGDTLDALQYLANLASARKNINGERDKSRVTLDIEGYRAKREETLRALARRMAAKALRNRRSVMLEPMTPYERRIIHSEIQGIEGVSTNSIGSDSNRKIVIFLTDKKPQGIFEEEETVTPLKTEFAPDSDDLTSSIAAVEPSVTSDEEVESETVVFEQTHPAEDYAEDGEDEDVK
ncbi:MAG: Jag N-terminal domain-containing protein [Clostridia bacterium]|nr:Jag N-terminal domain-containing protein [Clostridia bacterium]